MTRKAATKEYFLLKNFSLSQDTESATIQDLPSDIFIEIFVYLSLKDLASAARVCRQWEKHVNNNVIWKQKILEEYPQYRKENELSYFENCNANIFTSLPKKTQDLNQVSNLKHALRNTLYYENKITNKVTIQTQKENINRTSIRSACVGVGTGTVTGVITAAVVLDGCNATSSLAVYFCCCVACGSLGSTIGGLGGLAASFSFAFFKQKTEETRFENMKKRFGNLTDDILVENSDNTLEAPMTISNMKK